MPFYGPWVTPSTERVEPRYLIWQARDRNSDTTAPYTWEGWWAGSELELFIDLAEHGNDDVLPGSGYQIVQQTAFAMDDWPLLPVGTARFLEWYVVDPTGAWDGTVTIGPTDSPPLGATGWELHPDDAPDGALTGPFWVSGSVAGFTFTDDLSIPPPNITHVYGQTASLRLAPPEWFAGVPETSGFQGTGYVRTIGDLNDGDAIATCVTSTGNLIPGDGNGASRETFADVSVPSGRVGFYVTLDALEVTSTPSPLGSTPRQDQYGAEAVVALSQDVQPPRWRWVYDHIITPPLLARSVAGGVPPLLARGRTARQEKLTARGPY
jgi:hypothetical protein